MRPVIKRALAGVAAVAVASTVGIAGAAPASAETIDVTVHADSTAPLGLSLCITITALDSKTCIRI